VRVGFVHGFECSQNLGTHCRESGVGVVRGPGSRSEIASARSEGRMQEQRSGVRCGQASLRDRAEAEVIATDCHCH